MAYAYKLDISDLAPNEASFAEHKRTSLDGLEITFREFALQLLSPETQAKATPVANDLWEWQVLVNTPGPWAPDTSIEDAANMTQAIKDAKIARLDAAVAAARLKYAPGLPMQARAYELKAIASAEWDGTGEPPRAVAASGLKRNQTPLQAKATIDAVAAIYDQKLLLTEALREEGQAAINAGRDEQSILDQLATV